jgi:antitoxin HicB
MQVSYPAHITEQSDGSFLVQFIDLPDTFTEGQTMEEALFNASEVLSGMLCWHIDQGHDIIPATKGAKKAYDIAPDAKTQAALLLRQARGERSHADLARALSTSWPQAKRLESASYWPNLKTLDRAAAALGKRLMISFA